MTQTPDDIARSHTLSAMRSLGAVPHERLAGILRLLSRQLQCPIAWLGFLNEDGSLWLAAAQELTQREVPAMGRTLMQAVLACETLALGDCLADTRFAQAPMQADDGQPVRSLAAARIVVNSHVVGLACAMGPQPHAIDHDAMPTLLDLAQIAGVLLESALKEQQWRLQEERVRTAGLSSNDWLWESDTERRVTWVSSGVEAQTGRPASTQIGRSMAELNRPSPHDHTGSWKRYEEARARQQPFRDIIAERDTPSGVITVSISGTPIFDKDGRFCGYRGANSNITARVQLEHAARQAEQMQRDKQAAELASRAKSEFLSRMSHEMRTPLNAVIGFSQLLGLNQNTLDAETVREYAGHVLDAGEHLLALIDDVLDLQKIEEGALTLKLGTVELHDAVTQAMELLWPTAQARQVRLDNQVPPGTWVHADVQRLRQVLLNVASNGIKYNHPGGSVRWRLEESTAGRVTLCAQDNGAGMGTDQMSRLFQPFERLGRETSTIEGTGLGLIIARSLTQAIGGRLSVDSEAGRGTCVRIDLQRAQAPHSAAPTLVAATEQPASPSLRMLYVEDNRINAILFEEALRVHSSQIELRVAEDGDQALTLAQTWQPEVLVLDAHLPGISGFEVLRLLRTLPGLDNVPAYMCSADAMPEDMQRAYEAGFIGYWTKPINVSAVMADIDQCLQRARNATSASAPPR